MWVYKLYTSQKTNFMEPLNKDELIDFSKLEKEYDEKSQTWETNHIAIVKAMDWLIRKNERWPTKAEIAVEARLSRPTVYIHLRDFRQEELTGVEMGELKFMSSKILAKLTEKAMDGDMKSMRLAFELMGVLKKGRSLIGAETEKQVIAGKL